MRLSIIIPVFNEEKTVANVIHAVEKVKMSHVTKEILIINDASSDKTQDEIDKAAKQYKNIKTFLHKKNKGKGAAVWTGIQKSEGEYIIIQDADLEYNPKEIEKLLAALKKEKTDIVYGTRLQRLPHLQNEERTMRFLLHFFGNRFLSFMTSMLYGQWITDMETGYKLFPKKAVEKMKLYARGFEFEPE